MDLLSFITCGVVDLKNKHSTFKAESFFLKVPCGVLLQTQFYVGDFMSHSS